MLVIAHRGASRDARENTLEAFRLAVRQKADMIETDLHLTRDGAIALYHDDRIAARAIGDLTLAELRSAAPFVPTLEEALDAVGAEIPFNLELKRPAGGGTYQGLERAALEAIGRRGWLERTLWSSFFDPVLERLRALEPLARLGLLVSPRSAFAVLERAARVGAEAVHPEHELATPERIAELRGSGYRVLVYTVDDPEDQRRLWELGADGIFTNVPAVLREVLSAQR